MINTQLATYLALNKIDGIGIRYIQNLEKNYSDMTQILKLSYQDLLRSGWKEKQIKQWQSLSWNVIEQELKWAEKPKNHILHWHDPNYPRLLKEIHRPPVILYVQGQLDSLNRTSIAIVGSRHPSGYGRENTTYFTRQLAESGFCICSGLAIGIDGIAHQTALSYPTGTIAVVATGLDQVYPERHKNLAKSILENGAIVSEFSFQTSPRPDNFPRRNRIISGLSRGVLVIEAALKSGSLITARYAMEQNREVFAIPGIIQNAQAQGCHALIRQGAVLVNSFNDILEELTLLPNRTISVSADKVAENISLNAENSNNFPILKHIDYGIPISIDALVVQTGMATNEITAQLLTLELSGIIKKGENGGYYR